MIVYCKDDGNGYQGYVYCIELGFYIVLSVGGEVELVIFKGEYLVFSVDGECIFFQMGGFFFGSFMKGFYSIKINGFDEKKYFDGKYVQCFSISLDNNWIVWLELYKVYIVFFLKIGKIMGINVSIKVVLVV